MNANKRKFDENLTSSVKDAAPNRSKKRKALTYEANQTVLSMDQPEGLHSSSKRICSKSLARKLLKTAKNRLKQAAAEDGLKLDDLLILLVQFVSLSETEKEQREKLFNTIKSAALKTADGFREFSSKQPEVELYGSYKYNLGFFASDLDIRVTLPATSKRKYITDSFSEESDDEKNVSQVSRYLAKKYLSFLTDRLRNDSRRPALVDFFGSSVQFRSTSRVPIIFVKTRNKVEVDISVKNFAQALDSSIIIETLKKRYKHFTAVSVLLKIILIQHDLNKVFTGGLSSFKLYILIAYMFETEKDKYSFETITECLLAFFETYQNPDNFSNEMTISIRLGILIEVEFMSVYNLFQVRSLFKRFYGRWKTIGTKNCNSSIWYVSRLIDIEKLIVARSKSSTEKPVDLNRSLLKLQNNALINIQLDDVEPPKIRSKLIEYLFWLVQISPDM
eukprot:augustus_masked-scaffold_7-processed-gene-11.64-mRNA-1 protein AED:0.00 eAED:0.00 QI:58/0/0.5/1/0/0.5/2/407/447